MSTDAQPWDVVIVGAGLSGLAAGIRCAQFFKRVVIVEAHSKLGGLNSYYHKVDRSHLFSNGLHTVTNFRPTSRRWGRDLVMRNLGLDWESLEIRPPRYPSRISLPGVSLVFDNDPRVLEESIAARFPSEVDGYRRLFAAVERESVAAQASHADCFEYLRTFIGSPELVAALALPVLCYGAYQEGAIDSRLFAILFRSLLIEGCGSPIDIKSLLDRLQARFKALGGELITRSPVASFSVESGRVRAAVLADGRVLEGARFLSSAGLCETGRLCGTQWGRPGTISVFQWIGAYDRPLEQLGIRDTLHFAASCVDYTWRIPGDRVFSDLITYSANDNYAYPQPGHAHFKISCFSHYSEWSLADRAAYEAQKRRYADELLKVTYGYYPALAEAKPLVEDLFSPLTVERYTRHPGGTIYGGAVKTWDGRTAIPNLFIIGNDQGGVGIMGAMTSGVLVSNLQVILPKSA
ncbi:hypothetical protein GALL_330590 [mine drainage metagenome]|uniref:Uncharacterized protein n=1 Tax=mine drainage metagenome TaxID=410659 RepID=A0A1J5R5X5_9ZZZZ